MGKFTRLVTMLVIIDLFFIVTGQINFSSTESILLGAIINPSLIKTSAFFLLFFGVTGLASIASASGVTTGIVNRTLQISGFIILAGAMTALIGDYVLIFIYLQSFNRVLATIIMAPIIMLFTMTIIEWLRSRD